MSTNHQYPYSALEIAIREAELLGSDDVMLCAATARTLLERSQSIARDITFLAFQAEKGGGSKIYAIRAIRNATRFGLKEAKDLFEAEWQKLEDAERHRQKLIEENAYEYAERERFHSKP